MSLVKHNPFNLQEDKESYVRHLFTRIAPNYDLINDLMTLNFHRAWKKKTIKECSINKPGAKALDLCTGTGDIAFLWAKDKNVSKVVGLDTCDEMLGIAREKLEKQSKIKGKVEFVLGNALELPFEDNEFDAITVGFGLRNVKNLDYALKEIKRVLKPGGVIASLDLGHPPLPWIHKMFKSAIKFVIPKLGSKYANDEEAYEYLVNSLDTWVDQHKLSQMFWDLGYNRSYFKNIMFGSIAIVVAEK